MAFINNNSLEVCTFIRPAGQVKSMRCGLCGTDCAVKRDRPAIRKWFVAGTGMTEPHDLFVCPHAEAPWHEKAFDLVQEMAATASKRVRSMLHADLADIVAENGIEFRPSLAERVDDGTDMADDGSSR